MRSVMASRKPLSSLKTTISEIWSPGRYDIDGDKVYVLVQEYVSKTIDNCGLEAHRRYADVQYVAEGFEYFGYAGLEQAGKPIAEYDPKADVIFFEKECQYILLRKVILRLFFPKTRICRKKEH